MGQRVDTHIGWMAGRMRVAVLTLVAMRGQAKQHAKAAAIRDAHEAEVDARETKLAAERLQLQLAAEEKAHHLREQGVMCVSFPEQAGRCCNTQQAASTRRRQTGGPNDTRGLQSVRQQRRSRS